MQAEVLVVDGAATHRSEIAHALTDEGHLATAVASGEEALDRYRRTPFHLVISEIDLGRMSGFDLLREIRLLDSGALVVLTTETPSLGTATSALRSGAFDYLPKPLNDGGNVKALVERAAERRAEARQQHSVIERWQKRAASLERVNSELKELAIRDGLTGLFNYRYFREALRLELARCRRHDREFSLVLLDVDHFKSFNDVHGHPAGDELLREMARILMRKARASTLVARYGGEEFVCLAPETDLAGGLQYAEIIRKAVEEHLFVARESRQPLERVTLSLGVATFPGHGDDDDGLIARADEALYRAKRQGRNRVCAPETPTAAGSPGGATA